MFLQCLGYGLLLFFFGTFKYIYHVSRKNIFIVNLKGIDGNLVPICCINNSDKHLHINMMLSFIHFDVKLSKGSIEE